MKFFLSALFRRFFPAPAASDRENDRKVARYERWLERQLRRRNRGELLQTRAHRMI